MKNEEPSRSKQIFGVIAIIANVCGISAFLSPYLKQDSLFLSVILFFLVIAGILWLTFKEKLFECRPLWFYLFVSISIAICIIGCFWLLNVKVSPVSIEIVDPNDGTQIKESRYLIKGIVKNPNSRVNVVVRPLESSDYWVQDSPTIDGNGNWQINAYLGERNIDNEEKYEVIALAINENLLITWLTGNYLLVGRQQYLPKNSNRSNIITLTRLKTQ